MLRFLICLLILPFSILTKPLDELSLDEKIGQLFIIPVCPLRDKDHIADVEKLIKEYHIGGVIVKASDPQTQIRTLNYLQSIAKYPLLVCIDAEWGLGMRMINTISFPHNMTLGAIKNNQLIYDLGKIIGKQCRQVGAHINLAPVVDVNSNPLNPIIHMRSFGDNVDNVIAKASLIIQGMEEENIFTCTKHFPGHGDVSTDPHEELPIVTADVKQLWKINFAPFIKTKAHCIMTAHLLIPALDLKNPVTFSSKIVQEILQKEIGFQGLIITDALNMKALSRYYMPEDTAINAYLAGHDLLLYGDHINPNIDKILKEDVPKAIENMKKAFQEHKLDEDTLNKKVSKIMNAKEELGLFKNRMVAESGIKNLCSSEALRLNQKLFDEAITMVRNEQNLLPLLLSKKTACLKLGSDEQDIFNTSYTTFTEKNVKNLLSSLNTFNNVIICLTTNIKKPPFTIPQETMQLLEEINKKTPTIIIVFDTPYLLKDLTNFQTVIMAYENDQCAKISAFKLLFNKTNVAKGVLPINITKN